MCAIGLEVAMTKYKEAAMTMDVQVPKENVDHFVISTRENQLLFLLIRQDEVETQWEN